MRFDAGAGGLCRHLPCGAALTDAGAGSGGERALRRAAAVDGARAESQRLHALFDEYFEQQLELNPLLATSIGDPRYNDRFEVSIAPEWRARAEVLERDSLAALATIDRSRLTGQDLLSYDIFKSAREREIEGFRFPRTCCRSTSSIRRRTSSRSWARATACSRSRPSRITTTSSKRLDGLVAWTDQAIVNMREGVTKGYTLPRVLTERIAAAARGAGRRGPEDSLYWGPIKTCRPGFAAADRERLTAAYRAAIERQVVPTYRKLHDFMRDEYLPQCRTTVGLDALPDGAAWYAYNVRTITTTDYTPAQIHEIGLNEVERIHGEMREVMRQVGFKGDLKAFSEFMQTDPRFFFDDREELIAGYVDIKRRVAPRCRSCSSSCQRPTTKCARSSRSARRARPAAVPGGERGRLAARDLLRQHLRPERAADVGDGGAVAARGQSGSSLPDQPAARAEGPAEVPPLRRLHRVLRGLGPVRRVARPRARAVRGSVPVLRHARGGALALDTAGRGHGAALEGLDARAGARIHGRDQLDRRGPRRFRGRALHRDPGAGARVQDRPAQDPRAAQPRRRELGGDFDVRRFHTAVLGDGPLPLDVLEAKLTRWIDDREQEAGGAGT